ncbi:MmgE/PrpD family protein [Aurantiacibacter aquimixticola]|uniref:MmgE/PrpD n=1 Tax=Aurantiacibacter aquimixticola TaxID=1958945 RepID=A0A419RW83_9SPHN|nr:MmgE/PrpD family protein [Aurantiacibacter aquimixticola]RJY10052.1 MmgE/PrpD [Aurantiacibacter aquimixticola]
MSATADLLAFADADHALPVAVRADAVRLLGDTLAVGAAGVGAPGEEAILSVARGFGAGEEALLIGTAERLPAPSAAFVNGYRIHCLEWDAVHEPAVVHAMSAVTAALGAAIDRRGGCDPNDALTALAIGVDIAAGLGLAADSPLTFFRPATAGVIGAALAVARIDGAPLHDTLGIALCSAAGTMQPHLEGLATLPFQVANAARAAITASDLAKTGLPGPKDALEGPFGYFTLFDHGDLSRYTATLGKRWLISEVSVKPFPSGRASHAALGALQEFAGMQVERAELACPPLIHRLVGRPYRPDMTPAYARLCLQWLGALMLTDGHIDPRRFTDETMADPQLGDLAQKLSLVADSNDDPNALFPQQLRVTLSDGTKRTVEIAHTLGSPGNPLTEAQCRAKHDLARELAPAAADPRIFDDPLAYFTDTA